MDRPQLIRRLRIAVSVFFTVLAAALCVLWVRSYWRTDLVHHPASVSTVFGSNKGAVFFIRFEGQTLPPVQNGVWGCYFVSHDRVQARTVKLEWLTTPERLMVRVPFLYFVVILGCMATFP